MKFLSRDEYLSERRAWKKHYVKLGHNIHDLKAATKRAAKGGYSDAQTLQSLRMHLSNHAYDMMIDLEDLKENSRLSVAFQRFLETTNQRF